MQHGSTRMTERYTLAAVGDVLAAQMGRVGQHIGTTDQSDPQKQRDISGQSGQAVQKKSARATRADQRKHSMFMRAK